MKALFIGRFQPLHNGHIKIIQEASKKYSEIIIGIGSSQYGHTIENPFTNDERKIMIERSLNNIGVKNYKIVFIPDIHNPPKWVDHVLSIISDFDEVISNNNFITSSFNLFTRGKTPTLTGANLGSNFKTIFPLPLSS